MSTRMFPLILPLRQLRLFADVSFIAANVEQNAPFNGSRSPPDLIDQDTAKHMVQDETTCARHPISVEDNASETTAVHTLLWQ